jgi:hypothetical protein
MWGVFGVDLGDLFHCGAPGIDDLGHARFGRGDLTSPPGHTAVGDRRAILDHQRALAAHRVGVFQIHGRLGVDDRCPRVDSPHVLGDFADLRFAGRVDLGHDDDVRHPQDRLAGMVGGFMAGPQGVDEDDVQVRADEGKVVVAAVPKNHVRFRLGQGKYLGVVDAGVDHVAVAQVWFVLFALLDGAPRGVEIVPGGETLRFLPRQVAVGHGVTDDRGFQAMVLEQPRQPARGL